MTTNYTLSVAFNDDMDLTVETDDASELMEVYGNLLKGDPKWLANQLRAAVAGAENGQSVRTAMSGLNGTLIAVDEATDDEAPARTARAARGGGTSASTSTASGTQTARPSSSDPWADEDPGPDEPTEQEDSGDPWGGGDTKVATPAARKPAQSRPRASEDDGDGGVKKIRDKFDREWTLGLNDAPDCNCGETAARVKAKSQKGKWYTTFKCAKGAGSDYKEKCDFSEFPD